MLHLTVALTLALACAASPLVSRTSTVTLPLARHLNFTGPLKIIENDQARAQALISMTRSGGSKRAEFPDPVTNAVSSYLASVSVLDFQFICNI